MSQFEFYYNGLGIKQFIICFSFTIQINKEANHARGSL